MGNKPSATLAFFSRTTVNLDQVSMKLKSNQSLTLLANVALISGCTYIKDGECSTSESCEKICPLYDIQICARCANDVYRNFPNPCLLDIHNCRTNESKKRLQKTFYGQLSNFKISFLTDCQYVSQGEECPTDSSPPDNPNFPTDPAECAAIDCSPEREPVCARCGPTQIPRTFNNQCMLDIHNCFNNQGQCVVFIKTPQ